MSPIDGVSDIIRLPRLGKIRLGIKVSGDKNPYPQATDYFVVPEGIRTYVGDKPKTLEIMFPTERPDEFAAQWLKCYTASQGLVCKGDGLMCARKVDTATGDYASHTTEEWEKQDGLPCLPKECPKYESKQCRRVMTLLFVMPKVPGIGVWQLDTTSIYSIINVNSAARLIKSLCKRIAGIPLILSLEPELVEPRGEKKKTVHILHIRSEFSLVEIKRLMKEKPREVLLPELDEDEEPDELFPQEGAEETPKLPAGAPAAEESAKEAPKGAEQRPPVAKSRDPETIRPEDVPDINALCRVCYECWGMQPPDMIKELGFRYLHDIKNTPKECWNCFLQIKVGEEEPPPIE